MSKSIVLTVPQLQTGRCARRSYSAALIAICGASLIPVGLYFALWRPRLLPEDVRFMGADLEELQGVAPNVSPWLRQVFRVLGGYILATGALTVTVAATTFRRRERGSAIAIALTGTASVGTMAISNRIIRSDSRKPLVALAGVWAGALVLHVRGK